MYRVFQEFPPFWIGYNFLSWGPFEMRFSLLEWEFFAIFFCQQTLLTLLTHLHGNDKNLNVVIIINKLILCFCLKNVNMTLQQLGQIFKVDWLYECKLWSNQCIGMMSGCTNTTCWHIDLTIWKCCLRQLRRRIVWSGLPSMVRQPLFNAGFVPSMVVVP